MNVREVGRRLDVQIWLNADKPAACEFGHTLLEGGVTVETLTATYVEKCELPPQRQHIVQDHVQEYAIPPLAGSVALDVNLRPDPDQKGGDDASGGIGQARTGDHRGHARALPKSPGRG